MNKLIAYIPECDFRHNKLVGEGTIVQIDGTVLNYKCKSHHGQSSTNQSDVLCIIEYIYRIHRVFARKNENIKQKLAYVL